MALEIERKFLIKNNSWKENIYQKHYFRQGYLSNMAGNASVRVRIEDESANINIKSMTLGIQRHEYEYDIPLNDAKEMLDRLCIGPIIEKIRYIVKHDGLTWEIDVFSGDNEGLVVAEVELENIEQNFTAPDWLGQEVSDDPRYYNVSLIQNPYKNWSNQN